MDVMPLTAAQEYDLNDRHHGVRAVRLQGAGATSAETMWIGLSHYEPGGAAEREAGTGEKIYVVIDGALTVTTDSGRVVLERLDSCVLAAGENRTVENHTGQAASMLVIATS